MAHDRVIGVDVGGTKVSVAALTDGELSEPFVEPTDLSSPEALLDQLVAAVQRVGGDDGFAAVGSASRRSSTGRPGACARA